MGLVKQARGRSPEKLRFKPLQHLAPHFQLLASLPGSLVNEETQDPDLDQDVSRSSFASFGAFLRLKCMAAW